MEVGTKREADSRKLFGFPVILHVFICHMLLNNVCKNHWKYIRKVDENGPKTLPKSSLDGAVEAIWEPKPLQHRAWRGSGSHSGATLDTKCFQDVIFDDFGSILGPPLGVVWGHFRHHFLHVFLKWLFDGLGLHLGSQNTSKMRPKRGSKSKPENVRFCYYLQHFSHI